MVPNFKSVEMRRRLKKHEFSQEFSGACWGSAISALLYSVGKDRGQKEICEKLEITDNGPRRITGLFNFLAVELGAGYHESNCTFSRLVGFTNSFPDCPYGLFAAIWDGVKVSGLSAKENRPSVHILLVTDAGENGRERFVEYYDPDGVSGGLKNESWKTFDERWHEGTKFPRTDKRPPDLRMCSRAWLAVAGIDQSTVEKRLGINPYSRGRSF